MQDLKSLSYVSKLHHGVCGRPLFGHIQLVLDAHPLRLIEALNAATHIHQHVGRIDLVAITKMLRRAQPYTQAATRFTHLLAPMGAKTLPVIGLSKLSLRSVNLTGPAQLNILQSPSLRHLTLRNITLDVIKQPWNICPPRIERISVIESYSSSLATFVIQCAVSHGAIALHHIV